MPKPPSVIAIVRHGARLDAADSTWHLSSPTPYDPPLTYGGWTQSRALGARIATLLHAREQSVEASETGETHSPTTDYQVTSRRRRRKHRVVIHSSPFLRCLQTSTALSAGLAQHSDHGKGYSISPIRSSALRPSSKVHEERDHLHSEHFAEDSHHPVSSRAHNTERHLKTLLRIDAFLGEWLSPDYFEAITPPPTSTMMIASAKAELLRPSDQIPGAHVSFNTRGHFPGGWSNSNGTILSNSKDDSPLSSLTSLQSTLPHHRRERASTQSSIGSSSSTMPSLQASSIPPSKRDYGQYVPPIPSYAVSPLDPIPTGYVGHAKDACVDVDYAWDSVREPQNWGAGGELGEEWSAMHKRFRGGLDGLINWYRAHGITDPKSDSIDDKDEKQGELDEDTDLAVILVTHGAGCNALIGALTNHPALIDVGMASLTIAIRKDCQNQRSNSTEGVLTNGPPPSRQGSFDLGLSEEYDMRLVASIDHLRPENGPSVMGSVVPPIPLFKGNPGKSTHSDSNLEHTNSRSSAIGSIRRTSLSGSSRSFAGDHASKLPVTSSSIGLWGGQPPEPEGAGAGPPKSIPEGEEDHLAPLPTQVQRTVNQFGLWGGASVSGSRNERVMAPKRRWTVNEQDS